MPALLARFRLIPGATFAHWPVYYDTEDDRLCYEADGWNLVAIPEEREGEVCFPDAEWPDDLIEVFAERLMVER